MYLFIYDPSCQISYGLGTSRWGEFGEGGLLWGECSGKSFEWFDGNPIEELLCKVCRIYLGVMDNYHEFLCIWSMC